MTELLGAIMSARDRVLMLLILTIAVLLVTYIIYTISGRTGFIKYLPGFLLAGAGVYYLYRGMQQLTTRAGVNELMSAVMFIVIGLIGICFALILGIYHQGEGRKTKRRAQALDYLQEARSAEAVVYPDRREKTSAIGTESKPVMPEEQPLSAEEKQRLAREEEEKQRREQERLQQEALRREREEQRQEEQRRIQEKHRRLLEAEDRRFVKKKEVLLQSVADREEALKLTRLEKDLSYKNAIREDVLAYNEKAEAVNAKEDAHFFDRLGLYGQRALIRVKKWGAAIALKSGEGMAKIFTGVQKGTKLAVFHIEHAYRRLMTRFEARKALVNTKEESAENTADSTKDTSDS